MWHVLDPPLVHVNVGTPMTSPDADSIMDAVRALEPPVARR
jgi:hypothetical protein